MRELGRSAGLHIRKSHNWKHIPYGNNSIRSGANANLRNQTFYYPFLTLSMYFFLM